jgi:hypothetical protein
MAEPDVNIIGTLQGGIIRINGSSFVLHNVTIELDMSDLEDGEIPLGGRVKVNGHFETAEDAERGRRWVLKAHRSTRLGE